MNKEEITPRYNTTTTETSEPQVEKETIMKTIDSKTLYSSFVVVLLKVLKVCRILPGTCRVLFSSVLSIEARKTLNENNAMLSLLDFLLTFQ